MPVIEVKNLSYSYDNETLTLDEINFTINKGEFVSIVGHNGCGKSTLAKLLIGLYSSNQGEIYINGELLNSKSASKLRQKMALVFQNPDNQFIGATVEDDIAFGLENRCIAHKDMQSIIEDFSGRVGMLECLKKEPSMLSGGQKQRVAIAGALALSPDIVIFDEATSMLDPKGRKDIRELIMKMKQNKPDLTVISITHDIEEAYESDKVIVLNKGKIITVGEPKTVLRNKDLTKQAGLDTPFALTIQEKLLEKRKKIPDVDNIDQLVEALWQLK